MRDQGLPASPPGEVTGLCEPQKRAGGVITDHGGVAIVRGRFHGFPPHAVAHFSIFTSYKNSLNFLGSNAPDFVWLFMEASGTGVGIPVILAFERSKDLHFFKGMVIN